YSDIIIRKERGQIMANIDGINYLALNLSGKEQLGTDEAASSKSELDLTNGLTASELDKIDTNKDGVITADEFKAAYNGDDWETYWNAYKEFYNSVSSTTSTGTSIVQTNGDTTVTSELDKNGNLTAYTESYTDDTGAVITKTYSVNSGTASLISTETVYTDGTSEVTDASTGSTTYTSVDGSNTTLNKNAQLTNLNTDDYSISYTYNSYGGVSSVTINGTKYTDITTSSSGNITVKDSDGNIVLKQNSKTNGKTGVYLYSDGTKSTQIELDSDMQTESIYAYDSNTGYAASRTFCNTGTTRIYERDSDGNLLVSYDYKKDGTLYSKQTYLTSNGSSIYENNTDALWDSRCYYDSDGNVTKYETYTYEKQDDGTVIKTTKVYSDDSMSELLSTIVYTQDSYKNTLSKTTYNESSEQVSYSEYKYKCELNALLTSRQLKSIETTTDSTITSSRYTHGVLTDEDVTTIENCEGSTKYYQYTYYSSGQVKSVKAQDNSDYSYTMTNYYENGNKSDESSYNSKNQILSSAEYNENGETTKTTAYEYQYTYNLKKITITDYANNTIEVLDYDKFGNKTSSTLTNSDGSTTYTTYDIYSGEVTSVEKAEASETSDYSLYDILSDMYTDLTTAQINQLCQEMYSLYNLDEESLISYDTINKTMDYSVPEFEIVDNELVFS
ncbi:MAG: hypothetical protein LUH05_06265, partial [Candidatus Gastranaerophilales bacterium]|nr:hypothetical protein [Candidatus Gastranaerophilales bacterium]